MELFKTIWRGFSGLATISALLLAAIGGIGCLLADGRYLFSVAIAVVIGFALKPMWNYIQKTLML